MSYLFIIGEHTGKGRWTLIHDDGLNQAAVARISGRVVKNLYFLLINLKLVTFVPMPPNVVAVSLDYQHIFWASQYSFSGVN